MNWKNIDLNSPYESSQNILDGYDFDTLLLEISCNIKDINEATIKEQFELSLKQKVESAREIFKDNQANILNAALKYRNSI